jgi:hypothetical protein
MPKVAPLSKDLMIGCPFSKAAKPAAEEKWTAYHQIF